MWSLFLAVIAQSETQVGVPLKFREEVVVAEKLCAVPLESLACPGDCRVRRHFSFETCPQCGLRMIEGQTPTLVRNVLYEDGTALMVFKGRTTGAAILYLSRIEQALREAGAIRVHEGLALIGPFQLHLKRPIEASEKLRALPGVRAVCLTGTVIYVDAERVSWDAVMAAVEEYGVRDISWLVNAGQGRVGLALMAEH